jgi:hypothetical protein
MNKKISFVAKDKYGFETQTKPYPATKVIPQWWKDATPYTQSLYNPNGGKILIENRIPNASFKKCTPMLDALSSGYIIELWTDVLVTVDNGFPLISWKQSTDVFQMHGNSSRDVETPNGYHSQVFKYLNTWIPKTPPGYSVLVTSPFGYKNLPFLAVPAVLDSDKSVLEIIPPMWVKENFEGVVEKGTPLLQIIPFKRENWESDFSHYEEDEYQILEDKTFNKTIVNHYIKNIWSKKTYK